MKFFAGAIVSMGLMSVVASASAAEVVRHKIPNSDFPIAQAVEIPAGMTTVYVSGALASVNNEKAPKGSIESYGDTKTQTISAFKSIEKTLTSMDLKMGDVVKMQVFLVGDPSQDGKMDFKGFMEGYTQFFGTKEQPNLPARSVFQVASLAGPGNLVEIEVIAARH